MLLCISVWTRKWGKKISFTFFIILVGWKPVWLLPMTFLCGGYLYVLRACCHIQSLHVLWAIFVLYYTEIMHVSSESVVVFTGHRGNSFKYIHKPVSMSYAITKNNLILLITVTFLSWYQSSIHVIHFYNKCLDLTYSWWSKSKTMMA